MKDKIFELPCLDNRKSFYGKAQVIEHEGCKYLKSYNTIVCSITADGHFVRMWDGYSATTQRHVNSFLDFYGMPRELGGKSAWNRLPVESQSMAADMTWQASLQAMTARRNNGRYAR